MPVLVSARPGMVTVYLSIGNSDDKLPQVKWSAFAQQIINAVQQAVGDSPGQVHGVWFSLPDSPYQNACVCAELAEERSADLKTEVAQIRAAYGQAAVAWVETTQTEFV